MAISISSRICLFYESLVIIFIPFYGALAVTPIRFYGTLVVKLFLFYGAVTLIRFYGALVVILTPFYGALVIILSCSIGHNKSLPKSLSIFLILHPILHYKLIPNS